MKNNDKIKIAFSDINIILKIFCIFVIFETALSIFNIYINNTLANYMYIALHLVLAIVVLVDIKVHKKNETNNIIILLLSSCLIFLDGNFLVIISTIFIIFILFKNKKNYNRIIVFYFACICFLSIFKIYYVCKTDLATRVQSPNNEFRVVLYLTDFGPSYRGKVLLEKDYYIFTKQRDIDRGKPLKIYWIDDGNFSLDGEIYSLQNISGN